MRRDAAGGDGSSRAGEPRRTRRRWSTTQLLPPWLNSDHAARAVSFGACVSYVLAFGSVYPQLAGLLGPDGLLPLAAHTPRHLLALPLRHLRRPDLGAEAMALGGLGLAMAGVATRRARSTASFTVLWYLYSSVQSLVGHDPPLLFELGVVAILLGGRCCWRSDVASSCTETDEEQQLTRSAQRVGLASARWVLFRLLFGAGMVKLLGGDPSWWDGSATHFHYQSQTMPTPASWWMHKLPMPMHRLSTAMMFLTECGISLLCFAPGRGVLRRAAFLAQLGLQVMIGATGNFSFFQVATVVLAIPMLAADDDDPYPQPTDSAEGAPTTWIPSKKRRWVPRRSVVEKAVAAALLCGFVVAFRGPGLRAAFSLRHVELYAKMMTGLAMVMAGRELLTECGGCLHALIAAARVRAVPFAALCRCVLSCAGAVAYFLASLHPFTRGLTTSFVRSVATPGGSPTFSATTGGGGSSSGTNLWAFPSWLVTLGSNAALRLNLCRPSAMFIRMHGTDGIRPELALETASHRSGPWTELAFRYKPSGRSSPLRWLAPHNPRLDYAIHETHADTLFLRSWRGGAGGGAGNSAAASAPPFGLVRRLCAKILDGSPAVAGLLQPSQQQRRQLSPPKYVRLAQWNYRFTTLRERFGRAKMGAWHRTLVGRGPALDRHAVDALAPSVARAYERAAVRACGPWERALLRVRSALGGVDAAGGGLMWVCLVLPLALKLAWWWWRRRRRLRNDSTAQQ